MPEVGFDPYPEDIAVPRLYPPALGVGPPTGHVDSPLFTMLPAEVRLHIYAAAFEVSCNQMYLPNVPLRRPQPGQLYLRVFRPTSLAPPPPPVCLPPPL